MKQKISLNGVIDMHVHAAPDICQRTYNDLELTAASIRAGARAIVIKGHHCSTVARAALCNAYNRMAFDSNAFVMYGGLALNLFGCQRWMQKTIAESTEDPAAFA